MTAHLAIYGRLGQPPREIETRTGTPMAACTVAVDIGEQDDPPLWLGIVAFGRQAEALLRHAKGDLLSVAGRMQRHTWQDSDGATREQWQVVAESIVSARTVRPGDGRKRAQGGGADRAESEPESGRELVDDEIGF